MFELSHLSKCWICSGPTDRQQGDKALSGSSSLHKSPETASLLVISKHFGKQRLTQSPPHLHVHVGPSKSSAHSRCSREESPRGTRGCRSLATPLSPLGHTPSLLPAADGSSHSSLNVSVHTFRHHFGINRTKTLSLALLQLLG